MSHQQRGNYYPPSQQMNPLSQGSQMPHMGSMSQMSHLSQMPHISQIPQMSQMSMAPSVGNSSLPHPSAFGLSRPNSQMHSQSYGGSLPAGYGLVSQPSSAGSNTLPPPSQVTHRSFPTDSASERDPSRSEDNSIAPLITPTLQNVVSTVNLGCKLDLKTIALHARNAEYNPKRFAAVIMRIREPKTTALIFSSGKMVCTGAKSEEDSKLAAKKYARIVQKIGFEARFLDFKIQNIVGSCDVSFPIRLEGLAHVHHSYCSYEPELFPGLIYRMQEPKIVLLIFVSGKIVLTGAKTRSDITRGFQAIYSTLQQFDKSSTIQPGAGQ